MKNNLLIYLMLCYSMIACAHSANTEKQVETISNEPIEDSLMIQKKEKAIKCVYFAFVGLNNVIADHYKDAIKTISASPRETTELVYQPENHAPDSYIEIVNKEVYHSKGWIAMEKKLIEQTETTLYEDIMDAYRNSSPKNAAENLPTKRQLINRFIIPNLRSIYTNQLYWEDFGPRIEKEDMNLVVESLKKYVN